MHTEEYNMRQKQGDATPHSTQWWEKFTLSHFACLFADQKKGQKTWEEWWNTGKICYLNEEGRGEWIWF